MVYLVDPLGRLQFVLGGSPSGNEHKFGAWPTDDFGNILAELEASQSRIFVNGFARNASNGLLIIDPSTAVNGFAMGMGITAAGALAIDNANADGGSRVQGVVISPTGRVSSNGYPLLSILPGGPTQDQIATGSLIAQTGQVVSCSRALAAYCFGADGLLHLLGSNTVRVEPQGLLVEGASTNEVFPSGDFSHINWQKLTNGAGSAPVVTHNTSDVTDPTGANGADKIDLSACTGATDASFIGQNLLKTAAGWTGSVYLRTLSGTATVWLFYTQGGIYKSTIANVTSSWQRFSNPNQTLSAVTWYTAIGVDRRDGTQTSVGAQTIYAWGPNSEALPFASSLIRTTDVAVTRPADVVTVANPLNPSNPGTWRMGVTARPLDTWANSFSAGGGLCQFLTLGAAGGANSAELRLTNATDGFFQVLDNAAATRTVSTTGIVSGSAVGTYVGIDTAGVLSTVPAGGAPTGAGTGVITTQGASVGLGSRAGAFPLNGWLTNIFVDNK